MHEISLITGSSKTLETLLSQLQEYTCESKDINLYSYALDEIKGPPYFGNVVIFSSPIVKQELEEIWGLNIPKSSEVIIADRTINYEFIDRIVLLPSRTKVLFVNDAKESALEGIEALQEIGIDHLEFHPYYPGIEFCDSKLKDINIAITPGEKDRVPKHINKIYDIGPRLLDFTTIMKVLKSIGQLESRGRQFSNNYLQKIITMAKRLSHSANCISELNQHLNTVIDGLQDGLVVFDTQGRISVYNENFRRMMEIPEANLRGRKISDVIYQKPLKEFLMNYDTEQELSIDLDKDKLLVSKIKLMDNNYLVGRFRSQKNSTEYREAKNIEKGHFAKHTFDNIVGKSSIVTYTKNIAHKLSKTELTILLEGESGTGKELYANAIHNSSHRKDAPFLAVNFSALPDNLIESELFGYEEGAFTGASKGGKPGLFEQADGGTIFLDEIGDSSLKVQARLLRVLQEKEVMRIGATKIRPVNVRVVAATNKNLKQLIAQGNFRQDLYYRLKMGYIKIPALRDRKEDIPKLLDYLIKIETAADIKFDDEVLNILKNYDWPGNIRELKNVVSYMLAVRQNDYLTIEDIPHKDYFEYRHNHVKSVENNVDNLSCNTSDQKTHSSVESSSGNNAISPLSQTDKFILAAIENLTQSDKVAGRKKISELSQKNQENLTEAQVRTRLNNLAKEGYVKKHKGRGCNLTDKGKNLLRDNEIS
ncbi:sigma 54-interacting transcriptional regulator [Natranaerobius thermophilus]|uniref:Putative sigma54 specific transcriptional regulator n=1 Tax=Natranaerobius thermophilus (strain ATCC BAA-1301 / DSM 18059 / JW/NM-WN-LF) TaxID=457570 RepID=B2A0N2_NATTJ|nr:sigma 54-interacting transcriptional regulator [Natranaerobius thermophilus]ACB84590.1 putative sigma54 specific transcriptional regulator [Natranaerobius thermophilus JW/NM-WN-LF]